MPKTIPFVPVEDDESAALVSSVSSLNKSDDEVSTHAAGARGTIIHGQTAVTLGSGIAGDSRLIAATIVKALTGTCVISGLADEAGTARNITIPAGSVGVFQFFGAINAAGALTVTCSNASDADNVVVVSIPN